MDNKQTNPNEKIAEAKSFQITFSSKSITKATIKDIIADPSAIMMAKFLGLSKLLNVI